MHEPPRRLARRGLLLIALAAVVALEVGCATSEEKAGSRPPDVFAHIRAVDFRPPASQSAPPFEAASPAEGPQAQSYYGDAVPAIKTGQKSEPTRQTSGDNGAGPSGSDGTLTTGSIARSGDGRPRQGFEINFENTPVATVAKAILGDILGAGYTIDPRVQGTVSLSSGRPVAKKDLLYVLESALRANNIALVRESEGYRLVPAAEAAGTGAMDTPDRPEAGYGITVVPLQYVSAQTLSKLLESFAAKPGMVRADSARNLVIVQGNGSDRQSVIDAVLSFDADWMRGQSVGIYPVSNSTPEPVIAELDKIVDAGEGGLSHNVVKLQPISRQNAVLVVTRKPELLKTVALWISRLDKAGVAGTGVKVYRMRYGDARQVAALLNEMFVGGASSNSLDSPTNQLAPGGGAIASRSERNLAGAQPGTGPSPSAQPASGPMAGGDPRYADAGSPRFTASSATSAMTTAGAFGRDAPFAGGGAANGASALPGVRIAADVTNNAVLVYANQENYRIIERTLQQLDRPQLQVAIDATIAEVTLNDKLNYGVQFFLKSQNVGLHPDQGSVLNSATATSAVLNRVLPGFNFLVGTEADPRLILDALHAVTDVNILSTPSIVVVDNQYASLQVGDQIPITTRTAQAVDVPTAPIVNNIDYRNTGVILRVAPRITANGNVMLDIEQEISSVAQTATAETLTPTVSQRRVRSSIAVTSGQTVLLGGLMSQRLDHGSSGIPGLDQAPGILSGLFSSKSASFQRTELIIFIRPQIIRNGSDAKRIADSLRGEMTDIFGPPDVPEVVDGVPRRPPFERHSQREAPRKAADGETADKGDASNKVPRRETLVQRPVKPQVVAAEGSKDITPSHAPKRSDGQRVGEGQAAADNRAARGPNPDPKTPTSKLSERWGRQNADSPSTE